MIIDWQLSKEAWISAFRAGAVADMLADTRFVDRAQLLRRFDASVKRWREGAEFRSVINDANEIAAAALLLRDLRANDRLFYEPRLTGTPKSLDFCVQWADGGRSWVDVKTVAPRWQDDEAAWERFRQIAESFPANTQLIVARQFGGAGLSGQYIKARWSFVQRCVELEAKIALLTSAEHGPVRLLFCSEGAWHEDDLEDFADFYHTGQFRPDDWGQNAIAQYMDERGITFAHTIAGFCYLERRHDEARARKLTIDVRGPRLP
jgi:hypothetical protein